jgi:hypothetical protein
MRVIISGDFQAEFHNLDKCERVWKFILAQCDKHSLEAIVLTGDIKQSYNPVDLRVTKFWFKAIEKAISKKIRVIILLGNHDRLGLYTDSRNWLSLLRKAGAETFDKPGVCELQDGKLAMLPFTTSMKELRKRADYLAKMQWDKNKDILIFHTDVKQCSYNQYGQKSRSRLNFKELHPDKYAWCIGGHIHLRQWIRKNGLYVGSPFSMDWGEANQTKQLALVLPKLGASEVTLIDSPIPGWYDETVPNFHRPKSWDCCHVKVHVDVKIGAKYNRVIDIATREAKRKYPGAYITIAPEFKEQDNSKVKVKISDSDEEKIRKYVEETVPDYLDKEQVAIFLINKLKEVRGLNRQGTNIQFDSAIGRNVLSFKKVECNFRNKGLVLVEGKNRDWANQSNGTGKTNFINLIPVSLCGRTFKKQSADNWARRQTKDKAKLELKFYDEQKRRIEIIRERRPNKFQLLINKVDQSSGLNKGNNEFGTQALIEKITGFTWETLANSVYIDRTIAHAFITGSKGDRAKLLYKFQNLERFELALKQVKKYRDKHNQAIEQTQKAIDLLKAKIESSEDHLANSKKDSSNKIDKLRSNYKQELKIWRKLHKAKLSLEKKARHTQKKYERKYESTARQVSRLDYSIQDIERLIYKLEDSIQKEENIVSKGICPTCGSEVKTKDRKKTIEQSKQLVEEKQRLLSKLKKEKQKVNEKCALHEGTIDKAKIEYGEARSKADSKKSNLRWLKQQITELKNSEQTSVKDIEKKLSKLKIEYKEFKDMIRGLGEDNKFIRYCEEAFHKDGLPAFLNAQVAPILNKASEYYSQLFCDSEISVRFKVEDGDIIPEIINAHGGEKTQDQSNGESSMAGLITSFALKEIATKTNVLILDEPEAGLSPENIKRLAKGLETLKSRFESIFVVTHSVILLSELAHEEKIIQIEKQNRISRVIH